MPDQHLHERLEQARETLTRGSKTLGLPLSFDQANDFLSYLSLLLEWNDTFNLTSILDPVAIVRLHFLDSLAIAPFLDKSGPLIDIGTGAGFPGMPLKILFPRMPLTLVEPRRKRANFLRALIRRIQARGVNVIEDRIEHMGHHLAASFSTSTLRAVGNPELFLPVIRKLLKTPGKCLIMHGPKGNTIFNKTRQVALQLGFSDANIVEYTLPLGSEYRMLLVLSAK